MIAITEYWEEPYGTTTTCRLSPTDYRLYTSDVVVLYSNNDREIQRLENAENATKTMVLLGRMYKTPEYRNHHRGAFKINRTMFSKSGYLPNRIRRIRK